MQLLYSKTKDNCIFVTFVSTWGLGLNISVRPTGFVLNKFKIIYDFHLST